MSFSIQFFHSGRSRLSIVHYRLNLSQYREIEEIFKSKGFVPSSVSEVVL